MEHYWSLYFRSLSTEQAGSELVLDASNTTRFIYKSYETFVIVWHTDSLYNEAS